MRGVLLAVFCAVLMLSAGLRSPGAQGANADVPPAPLTVEQKIYGFSQFWKEVSYNFAHWETAGDLNWDKAYQEFLPRIMATKNDFEFYQELQRFCALLKDGHTDITLPKGLLEQYVGRVPLIVRRYENRPVIINMEVALADTIPVGSEILEVDRKPVAKMVEEDIIPLISTSAPHMYWEMAYRSIRGVGAGILFGPKGSVAHLKIQKPDGEVISVDMARDHYERDIEWSEEIQRAPMSEFRMLEGNVAYMALNSFMDGKIVDAFREKLPELESASGIIIDLRQNGGGNSSYSSAIVGHFTEAPFTGAAWRTPVHRGVYRAWGKYGDTYESLEKYKDEIRQWFDGHQDLTLRFLELLDCIQDKYFHRRNSLRIIIGQKGN